MHITIYIITFDTGWIIFNHLRILHITKVCQLCLIYLCPLLDNHVIHRPNSKSMEHQQHIWAGSRDRPSRGADWWDQVRQEFSGLPGLADPRYVQPCAGGGSGGHRDEGLRGSLGPAHRQPAGQARGQPAGSDRHARRGHPGRKVSGDDGCIRQ